MRYNHDVKVQFAVCGRYQGCSGCCLSTISIPRSVQTFSAAATPASQCVRSLT
jgi:Fe-S cluster biogenesis protein NfuA